MKKTETVNIDKSDNIVSEQWQLVKMASSFVPVNTVRLPIFNGYTQFAMWPDSQLVSSSYCLTYSSLAILLLSIAVLYF